MSAPDAVRAMLGARSVAVVGASPRPGTFGERLVTEVLRSSSRPKVSLVNPRYAEVAGHPCHGSLAELAESVDLVLLGVPDAALDEQLELAAARGDRSAVVFGAAWSPPAPGPTLRERLTQRAQAAGMALCGGGCMGFVDVTGGLRAIGYLEKEDLPAGPVALVSHS
ncbi:MAG TPA: CoA-binding protein, partial [Actinomycetes bacterium]